MSTRIYFSIRRPAGGAARGAPAGAGSTCARRQQGGCRAQLGAEGLRRPQRPSLSAAAAAAQSSGSAAPGGGSGAERAGAALPGSPAPLPQPGVEDLARETEEVLRLVQLLPPGVRERLEEHPQLPLLLEVVMDLGRPPLARFPSGDFRLAEEAVSEEDLQYAVAQVGDFGGDNRAGIDATLHRISAIRNRKGRVVGLTCRVGRAIPGSAGMVADLVRAGRSILLLGRPGVGKTTAIREIARMLADECQERVVIVDTSNEIGGDGDIPHPGIGKARRMQVPQPEQQHRVMIEAVENHTPNVIIIDEIGTEAECFAARTISQRGVVLVATAHGNELENVVKNPSLNHLVGGIASVTLGDEEARRRGVQKSILEREAPPTFDVCVEMASREQWRLHADVGLAVDLLLAGREPGAEVRELDADGKVWSWPDGGSTDFEDSDSEGEGPASAAGQPQASSSGRGGGGRAAEQRRRGATQLLPANPSGGFPPEALNAARMAEVMHAAAGTGTLAPSTLSSIGSSKGRGAAGSTSSSQPARGSSSSPSPTSPSSSSSRGGAPSSSSPPASSGLLIYPFGLDGDVLMEVAQALKLPGTGVGLAERLQDADAVLALRGTLKTSTWVKQSAAAAGIPVYSIKGAGVPSLVRALRTLLGVDPSPGTLFAAGGDGERPAGADPRAKSGSRLARAETSIALASGAGVRKLAGGGAAALGLGLGASSSGGGAGGPAAAAARKDALEEARVAIEQLVVAQGQPVELLPRSPAVLELQAQLAEEYMLRYEVVGPPSAQRLRVLPLQWAAGTTAGPASGGPGSREVAAAAAIEGARRKDYW